MPFARWTFVAVAHAAVAFSQEVPQSVTFTPVRSSGVLQGCTIVYAATHPALVSGEMKTTLLIGSIGVTRSSVGLVAFLKIGVSDVGRAESPLRRPHFAYLQTKTATTAKSTPNIEDGDEGFRLFAGRMDVAFQTVMLEMLAAGKVEIGFNRTAGGLDLMVPLDLKVSAAETPLRFLDCLQELLAAAIKKP